MREKLRTYVNLLFESVPNCDEDMKQEILQNTLDRYDDLVSQGKTPETAYRIAITGIGDINELVTEETPSVPTKTTISVPAKAATPAAPRREQEDTVLKQIFRAFAIFFYIICPIPLLVLGNIGEVMGLDKNILSLIGLCITLILVAIATVLIILEKKKQTAMGEVKSASVSKESPLRRKIRALIFIPCAALYLAVSFISGAWYITWLFFPLAGSVTGLIFAIMDLKETIHNEK